ncbi:MAG TPA: hypothetical protein VK281_20050 [Xanthobacteraceae bacterium]|nr:hypothetical protein [Xanthobacteraceae bacterium]
MAADVWLQVAMESNATDSPVDFRFSVDEQWLRQHTQGDLEGDSAHVRLNADGPQIEDWRGVGQIPFFRAFGGEVQLDTVLFDDVDWQGYIKLQLSGYGPIHKVGDGTEFADYCCHLHSGAVTVWTLEGFDSERDFFHWTGAADGDFDQWRCQIWPQPQAQLAAIRFGARAIQIDVQDASGRSRSVLVAERTDNRLWKLDDCDAHENLRAPRQVIGDLRQRITNSLQAAHWDTQSGIPGNKWIFVSDRLALLDPTPPEVYSRAPRSKTPTEVLQLLRPNFDISFSDGSKESRWSPAMASITEPNIELHDADRIAAEIHQVPVQNDPVPVLGLKWRGDGQVPTLVDGTLPPAPCVGVSTGEVQGGYIWQYGNTNVVPAGAPHRPALIRYSVPLDSRPAEVVPLPESVDGPLPIARGAMPDGWQLAISPTVPPRAPAYAKTISLMISTDATHNVELRCFSGTWSADSPRLLMLVTSLADPASPPRATASKWGFFIR